MNTFKKVFKNNLYLFFGVFLCVLLFIVGQVKAEQSLTISPSNFDLSLKSRDKVELPLKMTNNIDTLMEFKLYLNEENINKLEKNHLSIFLKIQDNNEKIDLSKNHENSVIIEPNKNSEIKILIEPNAEKDFHTQIDIFIEQISGDVALTNRVNIVNLEIESLILTEVEKRQKETFIAVAFAVFGSVLIVIYFIINKFKSRKIKNKQIKPIKEKKEKNKQ